jgi:hypothetical protein
MGKNLTNLIAYVLAAILIVVLSWVIYKQVKEYHLQDDPMLYTLKEILKPVHPIFNNIKLYKGDKSYTINKEKTFLCLYDENGDYYPINMLIYVLLHEVSHSLNSKDIGHTDEFHRIFDELLEKAAKIGVYNPSIPIIQNYCNHD